MATRRSVAASTPGASASAPASETPPADDADHDGIRGEKDLCPEYREDLDGFQDEDGCPDPDNDRDLIVDTLDACPNDTETYNGFIDEDRCPDKAGYHARFGGILFEDGRTEVGSRFRLVLDQLAST